MPGVTIKLTGESKRTIQRWKLRGERLSKGLRGAVEQASDALTTELIVQEFGPGKTMKVVTGNLRASVGWRVVGSGTAIAARIGVTKGPAISYAGIHERGGVIKARPGKALAVPLSAARTASGKPRFPGGPREAGRRFPDMFMLKRKGKPPLLVRPLRTRGSGSGGRVHGLEPLFVLVKSVKVSAKRWLSGGVQRAFGVFHVELQRGIDKLVSAT